MKRWLRHVALGLLVIFAVACQTYRPVTAPNGAAPSGTLRITFTVPRDVMLERDGARADTLHDVWRLEGRVAAIVADTMRVDVDQAYDRLGRRLAAAGQVAIVPDSATRLEQRQLSAGRTLFAGVGVLLILSTIAVVALIAAVVRSAQ